MAGKSASPVGDLISLPGWKCIQAFGVRKATGVGVATISKRIRIHRGVGGGLSLAATWLSGNSDTASIFSICLVMGAGLTL